MYTVYPCVIRYCTYCCSRKTAPRRRRKFSPCWTTVIDFLELLFMFPKFSSDPQSLREFSRCQLSRKPTAELALREHLSYHTRPKRKGLGEESARFSQRESAEQAASSGPLVCPWLSSATYLPSSPAVAYYPTQPGCPARAPQPQQNAPQTTDRKKQFANPCALRSRSNH